MISLEGAVRAEGLSKAYPTYNSPLELALEFLTGRARHGEHWALKDVSFEVNKGEVLGIVGKNGSGKSTLLKIIAGLLDFSGGEIAVDGDVTAILELGSGFHPDYTGRENVMTGGLCLGMTRAEIEEKAESIIEFSGIGDFIDRPFRTYSSGMKARLTFATATAVEPQILIIDEALATGDASFVYKSFAKVRSLCDGGRTVIIVSHSTSSLAQICDRVMWLDAGTVRAIGEPLSVIREYDLDAHVRSQLEMESSRKSATTAPRLVDQAPTFGSSHGQELTVFKSGPIAIDAVRIENSSGQGSAVFDTEEDLRIAVQYRCDGPLPNETLGMAISLNRRADLFPVALSSTTHARNSDDKVRYDHAEHRIPPSAKGTISATISPNQLEAGEYLISVGLLPNVPGAWNFYEYHHLAYPVRVTSSGDRSGGVFRPLVTWSHRPE